MYCLGSDTINTFILAISFTPLPLSHPIHGCVFVSRSLAARTPACTQTLHSVLGCGDPQRHWGYFISPGIFTFHDTTQEEIRSSQSSGVHCRGDFREIVFMPWILMLYLYIGSKWGLCFDLFFFFSFLFLSVFSWGVFICDVYYLSDFVIPQMSILTLWTLMKDFETRWFGSVRFINLYLRFSFHQTSICIHI